MEGKLLVEAARDGRIEILEKLLKESPTLVADIRLISLEESLLHVATKSGQISFVHELLKIDPHGAEELDKDGFRPLDIAVILGNLEIVKELLGCNENLVRLKGKEHRTALHYAAMKGRVDVLNEFLSISPTSVEDITVYEENALHLAVKSFQFDVFANLVKWIEKLNKEWMINMGDGNIVVHLAVSTKQLMFLELLLDKNSTIKGMVNLNAKNAKGLTAMDILDISTQDTHNVNFINMLHSAAKVNMVSSFQQETGLPCVSESEPSQDWIEYFKFQKQRDSPSNARNALLVVAAVIATVSFQACMNLPNGIFVPIPPPDSNASSPDSQPTPRIGPVGGSTLAATLVTIGSHAPSYLFLFSNSLGLSASIYIIMYLTYGFPFRGELLMAIYGMMFTYSVVVGTYIYRVESGAKVVGNVVMTIAMLLPYVIRCVPRWGRKAWRMWRKLLEKQC